MHSPAGGRPEALIVYAHPYGTQAREKLERVHPEARARASVERSYRKLLERVADPDPLSLLSYAVTITPTMMKPDLKTASIAGLIMLAACNGDPARPPATAQTTQQEMTVTVETLQHVLDAFNRHDLDAIMNNFSEDCSFDFPRGAEPWGQRFVGKEQVREALAGRFKGIPDVHYGEDRHWVAGDRGVSEWTLTGTTTSGVQLKVRGCDLWEFRNGKIIRKDSYWKIVEG